MDVDDALTSSSDIRDDSVPSANVEDALKSTATVPLESVVRRHFGPRDISTEDTSSDAFSVDGGPYEVIEYDPTDGDFDLLPEFETALTIEDNTPAAEAIRANANVHVSSVGKAARAIHMQSVRKLVKIATGARKTGVVRGKPPRIPEDNALFGSLPTPLGEGLTTVQEDDESGRDDSPRLCTSSPGLLETTANTVDIPDVMPEKVTVGTMEASKKVLGAVDPHDLVKLLRWRRKKKGSEKLQKSYVKGKVIDGQHELYTLSIAVMIGVRTSISRTNSEINDAAHRRWVTPKDFRRTEKYEFRPRGGVTPPHQLSHTFKFKDYCPVVFAYLRRLAGVNDFDFLLSVCGNANFIEFISNAKSGQFFFYSSDGRFMIKTMTNAESKFLRRILPEYFRHCVENPNTMITRFFGMYRVKMYHLRRNLKFVIMNSVYYTDKFLQTFYDLKGSSLGRDAKPGQAVKKDNDLRRSLPNEAIVLPQDVRSHVREQVQHDCKFLDKIGVMDYSMLVGIHHRPCKEEDSVAASGFRGMRSGSARRSRSVSQGGEDDSLSHDNESVSSGPRSKGTESGSVGGKSPVRLRPIIGNTSTQDHIGDSSESSLKHRDISDVGKFFLDNGLEEDDSSYIAGSEKTVRVNMNFSAETEKKKQATIERLYWPFHRLYDIHGHRLLEPALCAKCNKLPCACNAAEDASILQGYKIPQFVPPLSDRKDGGMEMDTAGFKMPMVYRGPQGTYKYDGKIFYMGIIDILQEYSTRKLFETQYRYLQTHGRPEASCVPPYEYSERFISFFDEYTEGPVRVSGESVEINACGKAFSEADP